MMLQTYMFSLVSRAPANSWCSILTLESRMNFTNRVSLAELTILPSTSKSHAPIPPSPCLISLPSRNSAFCKPQHMLTNIEQKKTNKQSQ